MAEQQKTQIVQPTTEQLDKCDRVAIRCLQVFQDEKLSLMESGIVAAMIVIRMHEFTGPNLTQEEFIDMMCGNMKKMTYKPPATQIN